MCGIAGIWTPDGGIDAARHGAVAEAMAATLSHRGPDGAGVWHDADAGIALAQRRLAIIDLSDAGAQPMVSASGRLVVTYNGEIYNHAELRAGLEARGVKFRGHSDTEALLEAIDAYGLEEALARAVGMFALALWDKKTRQLTLARDRLGIKPLYWAQIGGTVLFASELKAFFASGHFAPDVDRAALGSFLRFGYVPAPKTIFTGAAKLTPGTLMEFRTGKPPAERVFWSLEDTVREAIANPFSGSEAEALDRLEALLGEAVAARMIADVPLGAFLSGGIDSSLVTALMQKACARPVRSFSIGFDEADYDEAADARAVAAHLGTDHTEFRVTAAEAQGVIPDLAQMFDEPFADSSQIPTHLVSRLARGHVTVALSGDGGDEVFAGYNRHVEAARLARFQGWAGRLVGRGLGALPLAAWEAVFRLVPQSRRPRLAGEKMHKLGGVLGRDGAEIYRRLCAQWPDPDAVLSEGREDRAVLDRLDRAGAGLGQVERMQLLDGLSYLPGDILTKVDRASMAASLEARVPLIDHRVIAFAFSLPRDMRLRHGKGKWALRQLLARHVPEHLFERPKMGFGVPIDRWLRGPLRDWAENLLSPQALRAGGFIRPEPVTKAWEQHLSGRRNRQHELWTVLMFEAWRRKWLG